MTSRHLLMCHAICDLLFWTTILKSTVKVTRKTAVSRPQPHFRKNDCRHFCGSGAGDETSPFVVGFMVAVTVAAHDLVAIGR